MNKLIQTKFLANAVDCDTIWVKCSIPYCICPFRFHQYDSNGEWNGNRIILEKSKCMVNYEDDIKIRITNDTKRTTLVDDKNKVSMRYPSNPNGSLNGSNGFTNTDGRVTILMPHPERLYETSQYSYILSEWNISPWTKFFINAREWLK